MSILERWELGSLGFRFLVGSGLETRELIWAGESSCKARSPSF